MHKLTELHTRCPLPNHTLHLFSKINVETPELIAIAFIDPWMHNPPPDETSKHPMTLYLKCQLHLQFIFIKSYFIGIIKFMKQYMLKLFDLIDLYYYYYYLILIYNQHEKVLHKHLIMYYYINKNYLTQYSLS